MKVTPAVSTRFSLDELHRKSVVFSVRDGERQVGRFDARQSRTAPRLFLFIEGQPYAIETHKRSMRITVPRYAIGPTDAARIRRLGTGEADFICLRIEPADEGDRWRRWVT